LPPPPKNPPRPIRDQLAQRHNLHALGQRIGAACGGGQIKSGRVLVVLNKPNRKMCSLYLSLMDKAGVRLERFGDSSERLTEI
jgi:hypothetical protein